MPNGDVGNTGGRDKTNGYQKSLLIVFLSFFLGKLDSEGKIIDLSDLAVLQVICTLPNYLKIISEDHLVPLLINILIRWQEHEKCGTN